MPYKLSSKGEKLVGDTEVLPLPRLRKIRSDFTTFQVDALLYLHGNPDRYIHAAEIAKYYGYPNEQYFRGVLASLHKKGLLLQKEE